MNLDVSTSSFIFDRRFTDVVQDDLSIPSGSDHEESQLARVVSRDHVAADKDHGCAVARCIILMISIKSSQHTHTHTCDVQEAIVGYEELNLNYRVLFQSNPLRKYAVLDAERDTLHS